MNKDKEIVVTLHNVSTGQPGELDKYVLRFVKFLARCDAEDDFHAQLSGDTEDDTEE